MFDFVENFFFISLAITFALVLLLVYHFKQRISLVERKGDTMFELLTNVVKELKCVKKLNAYYESVFSGSVPASPPEIDTCIFSKLSSGNSVASAPPSSTEYKIIDLTMTPITPEKVVSSLIPVSDDSECSEDDDEDDDEESNSGESDYASTSDSDSDDEEEDNLPLKTIKATEDIVLDEFDDLPELVETDDFSLLEDVGLMEDVRPSIDDRMEELVFDSIQTEELKEVDIIHPTEEVSQDVSQDESQSNGGVVAAGPTIEQKREVYRKMNITQLKTMAVAANITADVSKMKKVELIKWLESLDE